MADAKDRACMNNAKASVMPDDAPSDKQQCPLKKPLRVGVFFDGTGNNRYKDEATHHETNVDRLYKVYHDKSDDIADRDKLYLIGVGAVDKANEKVDTGDKSYAHQATGDARVQRGMEVMMDNPEALDLRAISGEDQWLGQTLGAAFGLGARERLNIAYKWVKERVTAHPPEAEKVVDIYGFSRGAAIARTFNNLIKQGLQQKEGQANVRVRFLGIFDTVGSVGIPGSLPGGGINPGLNLGLDSQDFDACRHFTARNEVRANFPLSELPGHDQEYPGVHSDVGGGYANGDPKGTKWDLAFLSLHDMWLACTEPKKSVHVEMDQPSWEGVPIETRRQEAVFYDSDSQVLSDAHGNFFKTREDWRNTYVHKSATQVSNWWYLGGPVLHGIAQYLNPNKPNTEGWIHPTEKREKLTHVRKKLVGLPPNFSWSG